MKKYTDYNTAYCSTFRSHASAQHDKSDEHNFRLDKENSPNFDPDLSSKNITYIFNPQSNQVEKVDTPTPAHLQSIRSWQKITFDSFKKAKVSKATKKQQDTDIQNSKRALKKFIANPKASEEERVFFEEVLQQLTDREPFASSLVEYFKELTEGQKVSRYNDKIRRLETIQKINFQLEDRRSTNVKKQTEYLFKIPDDNNITLTDEENKKIVDLMNKLLPDHQMLYFTIHHDEEEKNPHLHIVFSNYNEKTNSFDLIDTERKAVKRFLKAENKDIPDFLNKKKKDFTEEELKQFGELWQDLMFKIISVSTANKYNFRKRNNQQILEDDHKYEKKKPITEREHNRQKKVMELNAKEIKETKKQKAKNEKLKEENKKKEEEVRKLEIEAKKLKTLEDEAIRRQQIAEKLEQEAKEKIKKAEEAFKQKKLEWSDDFEQAHREIQELQDRTGSFLEVIMSIINSLKDIFLGKNINEAHDNLHDQYNKLVYEHDWTQEQVKQIKKVKPSEAAGAADVGLEVMKGKLEKAAEMLDNKPIVDERGRDIKPK